VARNDEDVMNLFYLVALAVEDGEAPGVFNIDLGVSAWTFIIFVMLMVLLAKFAFPPILGYAAAREKRIQDQLDEARGYREQSEQLLAEQRQELENARQQAQVMIAEGRAGAERVRNEMLAQARVRPAGTAGPWRAATSRASATWPSSRCGARPSSCPLPRPRG
jgi:hypothetical protein